MQHSFDTEIAKEFGLIDSIILNHIGYWVLYNQANETNFHDGYYWTYNSIKAFKELFPYLSEKKIRGALERLVKNELVMVGEYNKLGYDRTKWYTLSQKGKCIYTKRQMELSKRANGVVQKGEPIPNINTNINTDMDVSERTIPFDLEDAFMKTFEFYPNNKAPMPSKLAYLDFFKGYEADKYKEIAKDIFKAVRAYVADYKRQNPDDENLRYLVSFERFMKEYCEFWVIKIEKGSK